MQNRRQKPRQEAPQTTDAPSFEERQLENLKEAVAKTIAATIKAIQLAEERLDNMKNGLGLVGQGKVELEANKNQDVNMTYIEEWVNDIGEELSVLINNCMNYLNSQG